MASVTLERDQEAWPLLRGLVTGCGTGKKVDTGWLEVPVGANGKQHDGWRENEKLSTQRRT